VTQERNDEDAVQADLQTDENDALEAMSDDEQAEVTEIRADIEETRLEMGGTLNELGDRLEPSHLVDKQTKIIEKNN
jgi:hypothetical protein